MTDSDCPVCGADMEDRGLDENWREFYCPECESEVLRPVASDHGDGVSMEDLQNISSFSAEQREKRSDE